MKKDGLDRQIRHLLKEEANQIKADDSIKDLIDLKIEMEEMEMKKRERKTSKLLNTKRLVVAAAVLCLMVPVGLLASGKITYYVGSTAMPDYAESKQWNDLARMQKKAGIKADVIKEFSNGYTFDSMYTSAFDGKDESGNTLSHTKELTVEYVRGSDERIDCWMSKAETVPQDTEDKGTRVPDAEDAFHGIDLKYYKDTYKSVPPDYELTEEDRKMEQKDNFFISYGSDEVEVEQYSYVKWEKGGVSYSLSAFDTKLSPGEMFRMAKEIISPH